MAFAAMDHPAAGQDSEPRGRAELAGVIHGVQRVADRAGLPGWQDEITDELVVVRSAFAEHRGVTEGVDGLYAELPGQAPRLARQVQALVHEHDALQSALDALAAQVPSCLPEDARRGATELLGRLFQHRQRGADLVYDALATDIGGET